jgi:hypothetical protein
VLLVGLHGLETGGTAKGVSLTSLGVVCTGCSIRREDLAQDSPDELVRELGLVLLVVRVHVAGRVVSAFRVRRKEGEGKRIR